MNGPTEEYDEGIKLLRGNADGLEKEVQAEPAGVSGMLATDQIRAWRKAADALESLRSATPANARAVADVVLDNLPYLENLIDLRGHESGLLKNHPRPCAGHDFCLMRQAQKSADAIRAAAATLPEAPQPATQRSASKNLNQPYPQHQRGRNW